MISWPEAIALVVGASAATYIIIVAKVRKIIDRNNEHLIQVVTITLDTHTRHINDSLQKMHGDVTEVLANMLKAVTGDE